MAGLDGAIFDSHFIHQTQRTHHARAIHSAIGLRKVLYEVFGECYPLEGAQSTISVPVSDCFSTPRTDATPCQHKRERAIDISNMNGAPTPGKEFDAPRFQCHCRIENVPRSFLLEVCEPMHNPTMILMRRMPKLIYRLQAFQFIDDRRTRWVSVILRLKKIKST